MHAIFFDFLIRKLERGRLGISQGPEKCLGKACEGSHFKFQSMAGKLINSNTPILSMPHHKRRLLLHALLWIRRDRFLLSDVAGISLRRCSSQLQAES
jgi:hypothetical protein